MGVCVCEKSSPGESLAWPHLSGSAQFQLCGALALQVFTTHTEHTWWFRGISRVAWHGRENREPPRDPCVTSPWKSEERVLRAKLDSIGLRLQAWD